jgi:hypothetical protein
MPVLLQELNARRRKPNAKLEGTLFFWNSYIHANLRKPIKAFIIKVAFGNSKYFLPSCHSEELSDEESPMTKLFSNKAEILLSLRSLRMT